VNLALNATKTIGINFCSVDIAELNSTDYKIVEINSGVMLEKYSLLNPKNARKIYETPIKEYFK
jgi:glutathione synthase/RimK-type ligase-like ATP-grasp enzyme